MPIKSASYTETLAVHREGYPGISLPFLLRVLSICISVIRPLISIKSYMVLATFNADE